MPVCLSCNLPRSGQGVHPGSHHRQPRQPDRPYPAGVASRSFRAVLAHGLEGRRSQPVTSQVPLRFDTEQPYPLPGRCTVRPRRPYPQPHSRACTTCPRRSGYNTSLFLDVTDGDQCVDGKCFQTKIAEHIDRQIAARPDLIHIENGWRSAKEQRPGAVQRGHFREIERVIAEGVRGRAGAQSRGAQTGRRTERAGV